jgi:hypothetical protein
MVHYRIQKSSPLVCILSLTDPVHTSPSYIPKSILILSTQLCLGLPGGFFPTNNLLVSLFSPIHATFSTHLILVDLIIVIIHITLSDIYLHRNRGIFIDVIFPYFTTCFRPFGPSSGESQYISCTILRKPSLLQRIRWS